MGIAQNDILHLSVTVDGAEQAEMAAILALDREAGYRVSASVKRTIEAQRRHFRYWVIVNMRYGRPFSAGQVDVRNESVIPARETGVVFIYKIRHQRELARVRYEIRTARAAVPAGKTIRPRIYPLLRAAGIPVKERQGQNYQLTYDKLLQPDATVPLIHDLFNAPDFAWATFNRGIFVQARRKREAGRNSCHVRPFASSILCFA
jgi:hypothetical protein